MKIKSSEIFRYRHGSTLLVHFEGVDDAKEADAVLKEYESSADSDELSFDGEGG